MHIHALMADLSHDGEPEPDLQSEGDEAREDAINGRNKDNVVVQVVDKFDATKLSDEDFLLVCITHPIFQSAFLARFGPVLGGNPAPRWGGRGTDWAGSSEPKTGTREGTTGGGQPLNFGPGPGPEPIYFCGVLACCCVF